MSKTNVFDESTTIIAVALISLLLFITVEPQVTGRVPHSTTGGNSPGVEQELEVANEIIAELESKVTRLEATVQEQQRTNGYLSAELEMLRGRETELQGLESELEEREEVLEAYAQSLTSPEPTTAPVSPPAPAYVAPHAPEPAQVMELPATHQTHPLVCTQPYGPMDYTVCETQQGQYMCRDDTTPDCGPWWQG